MRFKVGDHVSHSSHGSGQIVAIEERRLSGSEAKLYYAVATDKCTVWVPVDADSPSSLRSPVSRQELAHYRALLKSRPTPLDPDRRQRSLEVTNRLRLGSFQSMCETVRDLAAHGWPKPLSESDATTLRNVQETLSREWAVAEGISTQQADQEITALLLEARRMHHG